MGKKLRKQAESQDTTVQAFTLEQSVSNDGANIAVSTVGRDPAGEMIFGADIRWYQLEEPLKMMVNQALIEADVVDGMVLEGTIDDVITQWGVQIKALNRLNKKGKAARLLGLA